MESEYTEKAPVVNTTLGKVRGTLKESLYDEKYYAFDGIPYAQPPLGNLRFKEPQPAIAWSGTLDCSELKSKCMQFNKVTKVTEGSEDCLYLYVAVKRLTSEKPLPVMVYVHGGAFKSGDPTRRLWSPEYLMREDVLYISIGYRLGPFGFLSFADPSLGIPGNAGLKDIILALKWIKANAAFFNGDPDNITLFGHSSGSMAVHLLSVSPQAEGLFHKFILMAGFINEVNRLPNLEYRLARQLGYDGEDNDVDVYHFISNSNPSDLVTATISTEEEKIHSLPYTTCTPTIEPYPTPSAVLLDEPTVLQRTAWSNHLPLLLGTTSGEGQYFMSTVSPAYRDHPDYLLPRTLLFHKDDQLRLKMGHQLVKHFCKVESKDLSDEHYVPLGHIFTETMMHYQHRLINARLAYGNANNFLYCFDLYSADCNFQRLRYNPESTAVFHTDELGYIFLTPYTFKLDKSRIEYITMERMVSMFVAFARSSNPNAKLTQSLIEWHPVAANEPRMYLTINEELRFILQPQLDNFEMLDQLYKQAGIDLI